MGCGCNKKLGVDREKPHIMGQVNGADPIYVKVTVNAAGVTAGTTVWATGSLVDHLLSIGWLELVSVPV